jgi:septal ring factor EnvC (AmiA/AmiB activator)
MAKEKIVHIQNTMDHGLKVHSADGRLVKRFEIAKYDSLTGRVTHSGYTALTQSEFDTLFKESKLFSSFLNRKALVKHDELPDDAMTPHDALVAAKRESAESAQLLEEAEQENKALAERLDKAEANNKTLAGELAKADARIKELTGKLAAAEAEKGKKA